MIMTATPQLPKKGVATMRKYPSAEMAHAQTTIRWIPIRVARYAMGIRSAPFIKGMMAVVSMENMSPAPIMAAKSMITALSVKVASPRAPVQAERMVSRSAFRLNSGVGITGAFIKKLSFFYASGTNLSNATENRSSSMVPFLSAFPPPRKSAESNLNPGVSKLPLHLSRWERVAMITRSPSAVR